ncbi:ABC transporter permease subunit [Pleurocapsales cyanobacterium LEGE 10410]|nr:ABC transporter permease subunit [Pleurocapsales cyanobacterium LEGE 10410]
MIISNIIAIAQRELQGYFASPLAYIVAAVFWFISGLFLVEILIGEQGIIQQIALSERMGMDLGSVDVAAEFLSSFLAILATLSLLIVPILSMGLYAEENKRGTLELLATSPITNWAVASGKLLAVVLLFSFMILPAVIYEVIVFSTADPPMTTAIPFFAHLGLILLVASLLSLGMFISSLTNSTILAAILNFGVILSFWLLELIGNNLGGGAREIIQHISLIESYNNLLRGTVSLSDFILFFSYIFLGLFLTAQSIHSLRLNRQ